MSNHDALALTNSPFNDCLYAEVGVEQNGSGLTVLSMLARLGEDPWTAVARWAAMPRPAMIDLLMADIATMPLCPPLEDAHITARRLTSLLPEPATSTLAWRPKSGAMVAFYCAIALGMAINGMILAATPHNHAAAADHQAPQTITSK